MCSNSSDLIHLINFQVEVKTTAIDMSTTTTADYSNIHKTYADLDIGIIGKVIVIAEKQSKNPDELIWEHCINFRNSFMLNFTFLAC